MLQNEWETISCKVDEVVEDVGDKDENLRKHTDRQVRFHPEGRLMALQNDHCCEHGNETEETRALRHQQEDHAKEADRQDCIENEDSVDTDLSPHRHNLFAVSLDSVTLNDDLLKHLIANHVELLVRNQ